MDSKKQRGLLVNRHFSKNIDNPYTAWNWKLVDITVKDECGANLFELNGVEVPIQFSPRAEQTMVSKYFRMTDVPNETVQIDETNKFGQEVPKWLRRSEPSPTAQFGCEMSVRQVVHRIVGFWTYWGWMNGYFATEIDAKAFYDECATLLISQRAAPNTPQWFNAGLNWAYGITGADRGFWKAEVTNDGSVISRKTKDSYTNPGLHACFIFSVADEMFGSDSEPGIYQHLINETKAFVTGGGSGANYSAIRAAGELLSTGARATGLKSFLEVLDRSAGVIKSGSSSRRAAKMIVVNLDHPEIKNVINWKREEEKKVEALIAAGYDGHFEGSAYKSVSGQNGNITVRVPTAFLHAVNSNGDWELTARTTGEVVATVKAKELWDCVTSAALECGDPGVQFEDIISDWDTCPNDSQIVASNPCLRGDTWVLTDCGPKQIKTLAEIGKAVLATVKNGEISYVESKVFCTGNKEIYKIRTNSGSYIELTENHLVMVKDVGYVPVSGLQQGHELLEYWGEIPGQGLEHIGHIRTYKTDIVRNEEDHLNMLRIAGLILGDGWVAHNYKNSKYEVGVCFGKYDDDVMNATKSVLDQCQVKYRIRTQKGSIGESPRYLRMRLKPIHDWFEKTLGWVGNNAKTKRIPINIMSACLDEKVAFLEGYLCADGTINVRPGKDINLRWSMKSEVLANDLWILLRSIGVQSKIYPRHKESVAFEYKTTDGTTKKYKGDGRLFEVVVNGESLRKLKGLFGKLWSVRKQGLLDNIPEIFDNYGFDKSLKIQSIEKTGIFEDVYDATVPESHCFYANNILVHNCSEFLFKNDTACNLAALNVVKFFDETGKKFFIEDWKAAVALLTIALDITIEAAQLPTKLLSEGTVKYRAIGIGHTNIASVFMLSGMSYNSEKACNLAAAVTSLMTSEAYKVSAMMAKQIGKFPRYDGNSEAMLSVLKNHALAASGNPKRQVYNGISVRPYEIKHTKPLPKGLSEAVIESWDQAIAAGTEHGFRNAFVSLIQPSGTIGLIMDCDTTALEPDYSIVKRKFLSGGGSIKIVNQSLKQALVNMKRTDQEINDMMKYVLGHNTLCGAPHINADSLQKAGITKSDIDRIEARLASTASLKDAMILSRESVHNLGIRYVSTAGLPNYAAGNIFKDMGFTKEQYAAADKWICGHGTFEGAPHITEADSKIFMTANKSGWGEQYLPIDAKLNMVAAVSPFISGGISCTFNLPKGATNKDVDYAFKQAHDLGVKCITVYVDGSKKFQPLVNPSDMAWWDDDVQAEAPLVRGQRKKPAHTQNGFKTNVTINGEGRSWKVWMHFYEYPDGSPCEVWVDISEEDPYFQKAMEWWGRSISNAIQYGQPLEELASSYLLSTGGPSGTTDNPYITFCTSIPDLVFKLMLMHYRGETQWCRIKPKASELRCHIVRERNEKTDVVLKTHEAEDKYVVLKSKHNPSKCPRCGIVGSINPYPCPTCEACGFSIGGCAP